MLITGLCVLPVTDIKLLSWRKKNLQFTWKWFESLSLCTHCQIQTTRQAQVSFREEGGHLCSPENWTYFSFSSLSLFGSHLIPIISRTQLSYYSYLRAKIDYNLLSLITLSIAVAQLWEDGKTLLIILSLSPPLVIVPSLMFAMF